MWGRSDINSQITNFGSLVQLTLPNYDKWYFIFTFVLFLTAGLKLNSDRSWCLWCSNTWQVISSIRHIGLATASHLGRRKASFDSIHLMNSQVKITGCLFGPIVSQANIGPIFHQSHFLQKSGLWELLDQTNEQNLLETLQYLEICILKMSHNISKKKKKNYTLACFLC